MGSHRNAEEILDVVPKCMTLIRTEMRALARVELSVPQFRVLVQLSKGGCSNKEAAEWLGVTTPTMTRMVDGLVDRGLVSRSGSRSDGREVLLTLTAAGRTQYRAIRGRVRDKLADRIDALPADERSRLEKGLKVLQAVCSLWVVVCCAGPGRAHAAPLTLKSVFEQSLSANESVPIREAQEAQAAARVSQGWGAVLPQVSFVTSFTKQDAREDQFNARLALTQPLFRGFAEWSALASANAALRAQESLKADARRTLYGTVGQAYYEVISSESDLRNLNELLELTMKRITELRSRVKIGRSRRTELLTAEAQAVLVRTQIRAAQAAVVQARDAFVATTRLPKDTALSEEELRAQPSVPALEEVLRGLEERPDLAALRHSRESAEEFVGVARGGHWPTVDLTGNYYFARGVGFFASSKWDAGVALTFPIFSGGTVSGQVREAAGQLREQELLLSQARANADREVRVAHQSLASAVEQWTSLKEGLSIADTNYKEQEREYRLGLASNLEVLQALNTLEDTRRTFDRTRAQAWAAWAALQAALGRLP